MSKKDNLIWMDLEMTGLNPNEHKIIEVATIATDKDLNILEEGPVIAIHYSQKELENVNDWSFETHTANGLLNRVEKSQIDLAEAENITLSFIMQYVKENKGILCGSSIHNDRRFLIKHMPKIDNYLHYRMLDVSSVKEISNRWYPEVPEYKGGESHLALDDIKKSIDILKYYRENIFK